MGFFPHPNVYECHDGSSEPHHPPTRARSPSIQLSEREPFEKRPLGIIMRCSSCCDTHHSAHTHPHALGGEAVEERQHGLGLVGG